MNPLSAIFGAGVTIRNSLYDRGRFKVKRLARPVVSIGNISVGGSGKTPFVIALGQLLTEHGIAFDVLSRGYGRTSAEIAIVDPDGSPAQFGDEPLLMAQKLHVPVVVGADRYQAGLLAEKTFASKLHLLDDGFQHRRLHRDFDIVLLPAEDQEGLLLPIGRLREPVAALKRADAVVLPDSPDRHLEGKRVWLARRVVEFPNRSSKVIAFSGIGRPRQFLQSLKTSSLEIAGTMTFRDHHRYDQRDVDRLLALKKQVGSDSFITTEKDVINLGPLSAKLAPLLTATLRIELASPRQTLEEIIKTVEQRSGQQILARA
jgi:tetraacyldisaccharide 4'-kinase